MSTSHGASTGGRVRRRRALAVGLAALVAAGVPLVTAGPAAAARPNTVSVSGTDTIDLAVNVSKATYPNAGSAGAVIVMRDNEVADALSASALAGSVNAPILATPTNALDGRTAAEIQRVKAPGGPIFVMGGTVAISDSVAAQLGALGPVTRIEGADRYATSVAVAEVLGAGGVRPVNGKPTVLVANGILAVDALGSGPIAYQGHAIYLSDGTSMTTQALDSMSSLGVTQVVALGGPLALNATVRQQLRSRFSVIEIAGADRYDTAAELASYMAGPVFSFGYSTVMLAPGTGNFFPAMFAGYHGGKIKAPMVLSGSIPPPTAGWLQSYANSIRTIVGVQVSSADLNEAATIVEQASTTTPSAPRQVGASVLLGTTDTARVVWAPPASTGGSPITAYTVAVSPATGVTGGTSRNVDGNTLALNFNGLSQGIDYTFTVTATNAQGTSPASSPSNVVTIPVNPVTPPGPVSNLVASTMLPPVSAEVTWSPAPAGSAPIDHYVVVALLNGNIAVDTQLVPAFVQYVEWDLCPIGGRPPHCLDEGTYTFEVYPVDTNDLQGEPRTSNAVTLSGDPTPTTTTTEPTTTTTTEPTTTTTTEPTTTTTDDA